MQEHRHVCPTCRKVWRHINSDCQERFGSKCYACRDYDREPQLTTTFNEFINDWLTANWAAMSGGKVGRA